MGRRARAAALAAGGTAAVAALGLAATTLIAGAVSGGGYSYSQQGCTSTGDRNDQPQSTQPGCHNFTLQVNQGGGGYASQWHVASVNVNQVPDGQSPHSGSIVFDDGRGTAYTVTFDTGTQSTVWFSPLGYAADLAGWVVNVFGGQVGPPPLPVPSGPPPLPNGTGVGFGYAGSSGHPDLGNLGGWQLYLGADDNLDNGEHDAVNPTGNNGTDAPAANGPSDGGALQANVHPQGSARHPASLRNNAAPTNAQNPVPAADAGTGSCADGLCVAADTTQRRVYQGGCDPSMCPGQQVYSDQTSTDWRNTDCNSGSTWNQSECGADGNSPSCKEAGPDPDPPGTTDCDDGSIGSAYSSRGAYYAEPGVQVYEDPDPQASPLLPMYPICELYAGTEGVYVCGTQKVPSPVGVAAGATSPGTRSGTAMPAPVLSVPSVPTAPSTQGTGGVLGTVPSTTLR